MEQNGDPVPILINRMKQRRRDTKVKAMLTVLLSQLRAHIQFWKYPLPPYSDAHTIIAHTHVGRASDSTHLWFCTCAEKKSSRLFFRDSWNRLPNLCSALREDAWVKYGIWSVARPAWMVINGGLQNSNTFLM